jgi:hypothetical protein
MPTKSAADKPIPTDVPNEFVSCLCGYPIKRMFMALLVHDLAGARSWHHVQELPHKRNLLFASVVGDQAKVANAVKPSWQYMQQKSAHELVGRKCHDLVPWLIGVALVAVVLGSIAMVTSISAAILNSKP